jgi:primosomal protein N' (replication factor Y) (superfamily II helicase)
LTSSFARVAVNVPSLTGVFDYHLPPELEGRVVVGQLVTLPFGRQIVQGIVLELVPIPAVAATKPILSLLDPLPVLTDAQIKLAYWMTNHFIAPLAAVVNLMVPVGLSQHADVIYTINAQQSTTNTRQMTAAQSRLVHLLQEKGSLRGRQIDRHFKNVDWRRTAQYLVKDGLLTSQSFLPAPSVRPKFVRTAQLSVTPEAAEAAMQDLGKTAETIQRRQAALRCLMREPSDLNVSWVYAESGCTFADLQELAEKDLIILRETEIWRDPLIKWEPTRGEVPTLTSDQNRAWEQIEASFQDPAQPFLLHGVTGSGKTEIYIRAAQEAIRRNKQAIILVPEIALTPQTVHRFLERFPGQVGLVHSQLSDGERYDTWRRVRQGQLKVIIGPRSALFSPLPDIGFIAVDECHDGSYYQSVPPFYSAVDTARAYAKLCNAVCVLGSATPSIVLRRQAENGDEIRLLELPERIERRNLPPVQVVDMRAELKSGNASIFSRQLQAALDDILRRGQQAILFLNRRGTATYVFCRECGYVARCPNCDTPLTLHVDSASLLTCHRCGYQRHLLEKCPDCHGSHIRAYGLGSEKVESEVKSLFPSARTLRWDWDTTRHKNSHEIILNHFTSHRADVLIGTQMLAKGLDLPLVTLVGIVLAEVGLNYPDPFAAERTFDLLTQVSGRAGRSSLGGQVVLQTFQPESHVIQAASHHDYTAFFTRELDERRKLGYPPFNRLVRLEIRDQDATRAESGARVLADKITRWIEAEDRRETTLIGPVACFFAKISGVYRWQIILRGPDPASLVRDKNLTGWRVEVDPVSLL